MNAKTLFATLAATSMFAVFGETRAAQTTEAAEGDKIRNAVDFEHFTPNSSVTNLSDEGDIDSNKARFFLFEGTEDESIVTNHPSANPTFSFAVPAYFDGYDNEKYLALSTGDGTLYRTIKNSSGVGSINDVAIGDPINPASGIFIDTLVQFTPYEDGEPVDEDGEPVATGKAGDKLAIWLGVQTNALGEVTGTNLCVKARYYEGAIDNTPTGTEKTYVSTNTFAASEWVRLTVKAIPSLGPSEWESGIMAFQVRINEEPVGFDGVVGDSDFLASVDATARDNLNAGFLPALQNATALKAVGFRGNGAVDDFVVTTTDPFYTAFDFTLTWHDNITAVRQEQDSYTLVWGDGTGSHTSDLSVKPVVVKDIANFGETHFCLYSDCVTTESGYEVDWENTVLNNVVMVAEPDDGFTTYNFYITNLTANSSVTLVAKEATTPAADWDPNPASMPENTAASTYYPALASSALATADAKALTTWASNNNIEFSAIAGDTTGTYTEAYLLNCAVAEVEDEKEDFKPTITIGADGTPTVTRPVGKTYNGTLQLKGSTDLSTWTPINAASTDYQFYKYELSL